MIVLVTGDGSKARDRWYRRCFASVFHCDFGYGSHSGYPKPPRNTSIKSG
jgi:hypothetical protein